MARALSNPVLLASPEKGVDGRTTLARARAPLITDGRIGDFWIDTTTDEQRLYGPKTAAGWPDLGLIKGNRGWSPSFAVVADGARRVQQIIDWQGGEGTKPAAGQYVGAAGLVTSVADAVDVRGPEGPAMLIDELADASVDITDDTLSPSAQPGGDNTKRQAVEVFDLGGTLPRKSIPHAQASTVRENIANILIGGLTYKRTASEPASAGKFRSVDRWTSAGDSDSANGGWWELVPGQSLIFNDAAEAAQASAPAGIGALAANGLTTAGDGVRALYSTTSLHGVMPVAFDTPDGAAWYMVPDMSKGTISALEFNVPTDGVLDSYPVLQVAINTAAALGLRLVLPEGLFMLSQELLLPDNSDVAGAGMDKTILRLMASANVNQCVLTNANNAQRNANALGNRNIRVSDLTVDANVQRLATATATASFTPGTIAAHAKVSTTLALAGSTVATQRVRSEFTVEHSALSLRTRVTTDGTVTVTFINTGDVPITISAGTVTSTLYGYSFGSGPTNGSALCMKAVEFLWVERVKGMAAPKHANDASSPEYYTAEATGTDTAAYYPPAPSRFLWYTDCVWTGGGDDNFTTHGSEWVWVINNYSYDTGQTYIPGNSNCYEIDDSSRHIFLINNRAVNGSNGLEVKGHQYHPAARDVHVVNHQVSFCDIVGVDIHHTSHGDVGQPVSPTGKDVTYRGGSIRFCDAQYMRVLSYANVNVSDVTFEDDGTNTNAKPIAIENGATDVVFSGCQMEGFAAHNLGVQVQGATTKNVTIENCVVQGGVACGIFIGSAVVGTKLRGNRIVNTNGAVVPAILSTSALESYGTQIEGLSCDGYATYVQAGGVAQPNLARYLNGGMKVTGNFHLGSGNTGEQSVQTTQEGFTYIDGEALSGARNGGTVMALNRNGNVGQLIAIQQAGVPVGSITVTASATAFNTSSDELYKQFIGAYDPDKAIAIIRQDPVRDWNWVAARGGGYAVGWGAQTSYGISQDLASKGGWFDPETGEEWLEGASRVVPATNEEPEYTVAAVYIDWAVDQSKRTPYLWAAVSRLLDEVDALKAQVAALEAKQVA